MQNSLKISTIGLGIGAAAICVVSLRYILQKTKSPTPKETWHHIGSLKEIVFFPIKSSSGVRLEEAECHSLGLTQFGLRDRYLLFMNETNDEVASVGKFPLMLSIKINITSDGCLYLTAPNVEHLTVNVNDFLVNESKIRFKERSGFTLKIVEGLPEHHIWFSRVILGKNCGIRFYLTLDIIQHADLKRGWWKPSEFHPIMVIHDKSVDVVNSQLSTNKPAHHHQFRGNFLIESMENIAPFDEDKWLWLKIGDNEEKSTILHFKAPCLRCIIPNIDIFSCIRNADFEPLRTMKKIRIRSHPTDPEMGVYFNVYKEGVVRCGDPVYVQYK